MLSGIFIDGIPVFLNFLDKAKDNEIQLEKEDSSNKVVFIGDTMLSNISHCGFSKTKKVDVLNFPGATSTYILRKLTMHWTKSLVQLSFVSIQMTLQMM